MEKDWLPVLAGILALLTPLGVGLVKLVMFLARIWLRAKELEHKNGEPVSPQKSTGGPTPPTNGPDGTPLL